MALTNIRTTISQSVSLSTTLSIYPALLNCVAYDALNSSLVVAQEYKVAKIALPSGEVKFEKNGAIGEDQFYLGSSVNDKFFQISDVAVNPLNGDIYVLDIGWKDNDQSTYEGVDEATFSPYIKIFDKDMVFKEKLGRFSDRESLISGDGFNFGGAYAGSATFKAFYLDFLSDGSMIVVHKHGLVKIFSSNRELIKNWMIPVKGGISVVDINSICTTKSDTIYIQDTAGQRILAYDRNGVLKRTIAINNTTYRLFSVAGQDPAINVTGKYIDIYPENNPDNMTEVGLDGTHNVGFFYGLSNGNFYCIDMVNNKLITSTPVGELGDLIWIRAVKNEFTSPGKMTVNLRTMVKYAAQYSSALWKDADQDLLDSMSFSKDGVAIPDDVEIDPAGSIASYTYQFSTPSLVSSSLNEIVVVRTSNATPESLTIAPSSTTIPLSSTIDLSAIKGTLRFSDGSYTSVNNLTFVEDGPGSIEGGVFTPESAGNTSVSCRSVYNNVSYQVNLAVTVTEAAYDPTKPKPVQLLFKDGNKYWNILYMKGNVGFDLDLTTIDVWAKMSDGAYKQLTGSWIVDWTSSNGFISGNNYKAPDSPIQDKLVASYTENATTVSSDVIVYVHASNYRLIGIGLSKTSDRCEVSSEYSLSAIEVTAAYSDGVSEKVFTEVWSDILTGEIVASQIFSAPDGPANVTFDVAYSDLGDTAKASFSLEVFTTSIPKKLRVTSGFHMNSGAQLNLKEKANPEIVYTDNKVRPVDVSWSTSIGSLSGNTYTAPGKPAEVEVLATYTESGSTFTAVVEILVSAGLNLNINPIIYRVFPEYAPSGAEVFIVGSRLSTVTSLEIGKTVIEFNTINDNSISFTVPEGFLYGNILLGATTPVDTLWSNFARFTQTFVWLDNPVVIGETPIHGEHYDEMRSYLSGKLYTNKKRSLKTKYPSPLSGNVMHARDTYELRYGVNRFSRGSSMIWSDNILDGIKIRKRHIDELRYAISSLNQAMLPPPLSSSIQTGLADLLPIYEQVIVDYSDNPTYELWQSTIIEGYQFGS